MPTHLEFRNCKGKFKVVVLGERFVGKTSLMKRFAHGQFDPSYKGTIGIDFFSKSCFFDGNMVILQLWDTAGLERFFSLIPSYICDSALAIVVYDVTNALSFKLVPKWINEVRTKRGDDALIMLVGNKTDLPEKREVSTEEGEKIARELNAMFIETSAKDSVNIKELFQRIAATLLEAKNLYPKQSPENLADIDLNFNSLETESADSTSVCSKFMYSCVIQ